MLAIFVLALLPRALPWGAIVTVDEAYHWFSRAGVFLRAVQNGAYADTNLVGHPGVTTMWLGSLGILMQRALVALGWARYDDLELYRGLVRLPVALTTALGIALAYPLLRRLLEQRVALLGVILWASDPFLVAHSHLLHLDALLATWIMLSLLAALVAFWPTHPSQTVSISWPLLVGSGLAGGLALLTKSPSVILVPMVGLIALVGALGRHPAQSLAERLRNVLQPASFFSVIVFPLFVWLAVAVIVWIALWPAAWVDLPGAVDRVIAQVRDDGGVPHAWGNFFLGRSVADPGPLFYPVAIALRLTPWTLIGCLVALLVAFRRNWRRSAISPLVLLALFVVLFVIAISLPPKKFDRYALPIFPALDLIAAAGLMRLLDSRKVVGERSITLFGSRVPALALAVLIAAQLVWYFPYYLAYYNPLLGGGRVAERLIPVGWGEGLEQVAEYLAAQPDGSARPVAAWFPPVLSMFFPAEVGPLRWAIEPGKVDYAVLYVDQVQRGDEPEVTAQLRRSLAPVYTVRIHGIDYAEIYRIPPPVAHPLTAKFGDSISLRGYDVDTTALSASGIMTLTLQWQADTDVGRDTMLFVHILDDQGAQVGQADVPPGGASAPTSSWRAGRFFTLVQPIPTRADLPPGRYWIAIGLYDAQSFERLPLHADQTPAGAPADGANAFVVGPIEIAR